MPYFRHILPVVVGLLVPLVAWAQSPAPVAAPETMTLAEKALASAINVLRSRERVAAEIVQDVDMLNQQFSLEGNYYKDTNHRIRLQLKLKGMGDTDSTMLQVCDGKTLWDYTKVLGMQRYVRRDITQILKRLEDPALDDIRGALLTNLGFGGPEAMLTGLQKAVKFDQFAAEKVDGVDSFVLRGTWKDRNGLMGANDRPLPPTAPLPPYIPANVAIFIEQATSWPYRVEMRGNRPSMLNMSGDTRQIGPDGRPVGIKKAPPKVEPSFIVLKYKLLPVSAVEPKFFDFAAPTGASAANLEDDTEKFLAGIDQYIQMESSRKKAEAAKAESEPLIKAPAIDVPSPPGDLSPPK